MCEGGIGDARVNITLDIGISVASGESWVILRADNHVDNHAVAIVLCATTTLPRSTTDDLGNDVLQPSKLTPQLVTAKGFDGCDAIRKLMCDAKINNELCVALHTHSALVLLQATCQTMATALHSMLLQGSR